MKVQVQYLDNVADDGPIGLLKPKYLNDTTMICAEIIVENVVFKPLTVKELHEGPLCYYSIRAIQIAIKHLIDDDKIYGKATGRHRKHDSIEYHVRMPALINSDLQANYKITDIKLEILKFIDRHKIVSTWEIIQYIKSFEIFNQANDNRIKSHIKELFGYRFITNINLTDKYKHLCDSNAKHSQILWIANYF